MKKVLVLVEGFTEKRFVEDILKPYFHNKGIFVIARNLKGISKYEIINKEVNNLLKDTSATLVTTMIDYYRLPSDFPQKQQLNLQLQSYKKVEILESAFGDDIQNSKFLPYLQLHEFEALLFSEVSHFSKVLSTKSHVSYFEKIVQTLEPEEINDQPNTSPANRIKNIFPQYQKESHGAILAKAIGLEKMREKCPHFSQWIELLENSL
ncbi:DUF4276 family protein [Sulfuricurvum sp.]|jgi:hypothetical protein|uniref:DUF4276 family protein n=1 Tax=Sulfuricurvum sp. TaxID=2025608 RepID=UPI002621C11B|nr:DUF4276 family protein [Sulfuricurvum sp.]MDD3597728.1 DUF4276 family protein [Sulfuricurvum sp.]